jgi:hypothetical protein
VSQDLCIVFDFLEALLFGMHSERSWIRPRKMELCMFHCLTSASDPHGHTSGIGGSGGRDLNRVIFFLRVMMCFVILVCLSLFKNFTIRLAFLIAGMECSVSIP